LKEGLQTGAVNDLKVNTELTTLVRDDQDTDGATASLECGLETSPEIRLINDGNGLLNITTLSHGNDGTILKIENSVLLEDGPEHGLDNDRWAWVGDE